jgi:hypothetical protein
MKDTADMAFDDRIAKGKGVELLIVAELRKQGVVFINPTPDEDMHQKIDGWIIGEDGVRRSVQIKYREKGDDIIIEIIKDINRNLPGRDILSKADLYLLVNRLGEGRLFDNIPLKEMALKMLKYYHAVKEMAWTEEWSSNEWDLKLRNDRSHGNKKLIGFIDPSYFKVLQQWKNLPTNI